MEEHGEYWCHVWLAPQSLAVVKQPICIASPLRKYTQYRRGSDLLSRQDKERHPCQVAHLVEERCKDLIKPALLVHLKFLCEQAPLRQVQCSSASIEGSRSDSYLEGC